MFAKQYIFLVNISVISTSFLTHHIYLKRHVIVWIFLGLEGSRFMWNVGLVLILNHVNDIAWKIMHVDYNCYPKLNMDIVYLIPYSVINVRLAAQKLSTTVSKLVSNYGSADAAKFWLMLDTFFDLINVSRTTALLCGLKPFNSPFPWTDDYEISLLKSRFFKNFDDCFRSIEARPEAYTKYVKQKMLWFMSSQKVWKSLYILL